MKGRDLAIVGAIVGGGIILFSVLNKSTSSSAGNSVASSAGEYVGSAITSTVYDTASGIGKGVVKTTVTYAKNNIQTSKATVGKQISVASPILSLLGVWGWGK